MAHFAELNENNEVLRVVVVNNDCCLNSEGVEDESIGAAFCTQLLGGNNRWMQGSYSGSFRKRMPGIGFKYDEDRDAFIPPKPLAPYDDFVLDENLLDWTPPLPRPNDGKNYFWDPVDKDWKEPPIEMNF